MKHISRLLMQARAARNGNGMHVLGFIDYVPEKQCFTASGTIWNGVPGTGESFYSEHKTEEEAVAACDAIAAKYPNCENLTFVNCYE